MAAKPTTVQVDLGGRAVTVPRAASTTATGWRPRGSPCWRPPGPSASGFPAKLDPLEIAPGLGIVSVMAFRYDACDIDESRASARIANVDVLVAGL